MELSAYGFNQTGVKSTTGRKLYSLGEVKQIRKGRFYLVAMGVSANEHQPWTLSFAAKDAQAIIESFQKHLAARKEYSEIVPIELLSEVPNNHDQQGPQTIQATKQNLRNVLALMAGEKVGGDWIRAVPNSERLTKIMPEDTLVLFFSGHGFTAPDGTFYFVPYDTGTEPFSSHRTKGSLPAGRDLVPKVI